jgi:hypothetical protein
MSSRALLPALLLLGACSPRTPIEGNVVDGLTGQPRAELTVLARAQGTGDLTCQVLEGKTDASGAFTLANSCPDTLYSIDTTDDLLLLAGGPQVQGGQEVAASLELQAWRAPAGPGIFVLADDSLKPVRSRTRVMRDEKIVDTDVVAVYPESTFRNPTSVAPGQHLVLSGTARIAKTQFVPVVPETERRAFASGNALTGHPFLGIDFTSDTEYTEVEADLDESKIRTATADKRVVRYIPAEALPPGQYALYGEGDDEALIVRFGESGDNATAQVQ